MPRIKGSKKGARAQREKRRQKYQKGKMNAMQVDNSSEITDVPEIEDSTSTVGELVILDDTVTAERNNSDSPCLAEIITSSTQLHTKSDTETMADCIIVREECGDCVNITPSTPLDTNSDTDTMADCIIVREEYGDCVNFTPVDLSWQTQTSEQLSLQVIGTSCNSENIYRAGPPKAVKEIIGDGNCFFRTVSYFITGSEEFHGEIRALVVSHMRNIKEVLEERCLDTSLEQYLQTSEMDINHSWTSEIEMFATAHLLGTDIYVYSPVYKRWEKHSGKFLDSTMTVHDQSIFINHANRNHYEAVLEVFPIEDVLYQNQNESISQVSCDQDTLTGEQIEIDHPRKRKSTENASEEYRERKNAKLRQKYRENELYRESKKKQSKRKYDESEEHKEDVKKMYIQKYKENEQYRAKLKQTSKQKYAENDEHRQNVKEASKQKYEEDEEHRNNKKESSKQKYGENEEHRNNVKDASKQKYAENEEHRNNVKDASKQKYAEDEEHRSNVKDASKQKYAENEEHRNNVKDASKQKYAENEEHRSNVKDASKQKYAENEEHRNNVKQTYIQKYAENEQYRENLKKKSKDLYKKNPIPAKEKAQMQYSKQKELRADHEFIIETFKQQCKEDIPLYTCVVCHRLLFQKGVRAFQMEHYRQHEQLVQECVDEKYVHKCIDECATDCKLMKSPKGKKWICSTCNTHFLNGNIPPQAVVNNLKLETVQPVMESMNVLEKQLIALRLPFMKMAVLPQGGQKGIKGPIVMVNSNIETTRTSLPRPLTQESQIVAVKLKRKLEFKGHVTYQLVDTAKIEQALNFLTKNNPLYKDILHNDSWVESTEDVELQTLLLKQEQNVDDETSNSEPCITVEKSTSDQELSDDETENINDHEYERMRGVENDSCLQPPDLRTEVYTQLRDKIFSIAPAAENVPISVFEDDMGEAKAFPTLFPNAKNTFEEPRSKELTRSKYFNSRLLNADTRFARDTQYIFYAQYCVELTKLISGISIAMRKGHMFRKDGTKITAKMLTDKEQVHNFLKADDAFEHMTALRGSPEYWNKTLSDLFSLIRQIGIPTWFCTFSAAELSRWPEIIETIELQNGNIVDFSELDWAEKCEVLRSNPVTAVRMFQERVANFMKTVINSPAQPIGEVVDHFYRVEFQKRGAPHIHCLFWIKDSPKLNEDDDDTICEFIDKYVSSELPDENFDPVLHEVVKTCQTHSKQHTKSCKKNKKECRYNFPRPASDETFIVRPKNEEDDDNDGDDFEKAKLKLETLKELINNKGDDNLTFSDIRKKAGFHSQKEFESAVALLSQKESIVLKRDVSDIWVNSYNPTLIKAWNANMDIQFVLDPYSCIMYIVSYISKSEKELGEILRFAREEMAEDVDSDLCKQMRKLGTVYIENREVSVQESVVRTCGLPLKDCSRDVIFVSSDKNATRMSKSFAEIQNAAKNDGDDDIWLTSKLDKYRARPKGEIMDELCHASFVSEYRDICKTEANRAKESKNSNLIELNNNLGYVLKRTRGKPAIIRYAKYSETRDPEKYFYSMFRLFLPHYTEEQLKPPTFDTYQDFYETGNVALTPDKDPVPVKLLVAKNKAKFDQGSEQLAEAFDQLKTHGPLEDAWSLLAPQTEQSRIDAQDEIAQNIDDVEIGDADVVELRETPSKVASLCSVELTKEATIQPMLKYMNEKQKKVFYSVRQWALDKSNGKNPDPFFLHISGGGGVGKSHLIKCIYYCVTQLLKDKNNPDEPSVLLTAPTGTAAFTVGGFTVHSALKIPLKLPKNASEIKNLGPDQMNTLQAKLSNLQLLIIDEISMVNRKVLHCIHKRLKQVKKISINDRMAYFGNVSVLAVGDMYQLPPVKATSLIVPNRVEGIDLFNDLFKIVELDEIMRQKDDQTFAQLLNRMRTHMKGKSLTEQDKNILESRNDLPNIPVDALHVFATNVQADTHNSDMLQMKCENHVKLEAQDYSKDQTSGKMIRKAVTKGSKDDLYSVLQLGIGCRVMLMRNIDVTDGLVNGVFGTVVGFSNANMKREITQIYVKFDNEKIGLKTGNHDRPELPKGAVIIDLFEENLDGNEHIKRRQFPLKLGWGTTIHKTQGLTVQEIVYDMKKTFTCGQAYVALSRVTKLSGLYLKNFDPTLIYRDEKVHKNLKLMPSYCPDIVKNQGKPALSIVHHNVQGLRSKMEDLKRNSDIKGQDIIMLTETHLNSQVPDEKINMTEYKPYRKDRVQSDGGGVLIQVMQEFVVTPLKIQTENIECLAIEICGKEMPPITLVVLYRTPTQTVNSTKKEIINLLTQMDKQNIQNIIIAGDLNENLLTSTEHPIEKTFSEFGFVQHIKQPTTTYGSLLDVMYTKLVSFPHQFATVIPTYYSDHEAILLQLYLQKDSD